MDRSSRVLVAVDTSNFEYACIFAAASKWERLHSDEASLVLKENVWKTDQENLPELLNFDSFRRTLNFVVQEKLDSIMTFISRNHQAEIDCATGVDVVLALDGNLDKNFRKKLYPEYKAQREKTRQRFNIKGLKPYIQNVVFKELNVEDALGYKMVRVEDCECDDVIATLMENYTDYMLRIVVSSDRDFLQLKDTVQYNCWGEPVERIIKDVVDTPVSRSDFLLWKIVRGDASDNIKNVFPKYGDKKSWGLVQDREKLRQMLKESNDAAERFKLNSVLIDFRKIPAKCTERILGALDEKLSQVKEPPPFSLDECMVV